MESARFQFHYKMPQSFFCGCPKTRLPDFIQANQVEMRTGSAQQRCQFLYFSRGVVDAGHDSVFI